MANILHKLEGVLKKKNKNNVIILVVKIYKGQTFCSFPSPASRNLKVEAYQQWYSSTVGPPQLGLYSICARRRPFLSLLEEAGPEAQVPDSP